MTTNKTHPHAEILRALANGVPVEEFECRAFDWDEDCWRVLNSNIAAELIFNPDVWHVRRKPQYIMVNGFMVPKPLIVVARSADYFYPDLEDQLLYESYTWTGDTLDLRLLQRGLIHSTHEAAIAHAKAMLGIDPEYFK